MGSSGHCSTRTRGCDGVLVGWAIGTRWGKGGTDFEDSITKRGLPVQCLSNSVGSLGYRPWGYLTSGAQHLMGTVHQGHHESRNLGTPHFGNTMPMGFEDSLSQGLYGVGVTPIK